MLKVSSPTRWAFLLQLRRARARRRSGFYVWFCIALNTGFFASTLLAYKSILVLYILGVDYLSKFEREALFCGVDSFDFKFWLLFVHSDGRSISCASSMDAWEVYWIFIMPPFSICWSSPRCTSYLLMLYSELQRQWNMMNTLSYCRPVYAASCACSEPIAVPARVHHLLHQFCIPFLRSMMVP